ncbi:MAG TPA: glucoamylase family protein [Gemmatimonadaceae bacterium]|nr:glucoamylase family protein [Gemmatimonadaceae bacterium]
MATRSSATPRPRLLAHLFSRASDVRAELLAGPLRGELLGPDQLAERARTVAKGERLRTGRKIWRTAPLLARLNETKRVLDVAHRRLTDASDRGSEIGPAGEWLLDNYFVVQEHIREVRASLPRGYYRVLPELAAGTLTGYPRVYELAITLISHTEARLDLDNVHLVVGAFQDVAPLRLGELWAIPAMLRLGLIESVRRMTLRTVQRLDEVERADHMATRLLDASEAGPNELGVALSELVDSGVPLNPVFIARFLQRLRMARGSFTPLGWLEQWIADEGMTGEEAASLSTQRVASTQVTMANSITSLRAIGRMDWREFVERQSVMDAVLRLDPSGHYQRMTFATRDQYRHVVERIALRTGSEEAAVASEAIELARRHMAGVQGGGADDEVRAHVGYYLIDDGLPDLERLTGYTSRPREALHRWVLRHPNTVFVGGVLGGTLLALVVLLRLGGTDTSLAWITIALLGLIPASEIALSMMNRLVAFLPPAVLPKLELRDEDVPPALRTAVVIPTLFGSVDAVADALETIEVQFLANREAHLHFAILSDFTDSSAEHEDGDAAIRQAAVDGVRALNARYAPESRDAFYLFHRDRRWNAAQGVWMGWERKRGKLSQFNHFLRGTAGSEAFSTIEGNVEPLRSVRYVITLDADTVLPPDAAPLLVGTLAHPLNRAVYDAARGRVVRGYGILQPRVGVSLPSAHQSRFAAIQSGQPGVDPYTTAVSDVYQDLYGEGSFTGKGIYDVEAFERATHGRFPENRLLSHDLIEGSYARAGLVTDITVYDDYPGQYLTYTRRKHRWLRGDWQLLQWLTPRVPGPDGPESNRLGLLSRWKIFDNLRRSVFEISLVVFLIAGWWFLPGSPVRWTVLALLALAAPWIIALAIAILSPPFDKSWRAYYAAIGRDAVTSAKQVTLAIAFLPHQAWISLDGIARTLWRLAVSKRRLLEWQTALHAERRHRRDASATWRAMWPVSAAALALLVTLGVDAPVLIPLILLWGASPALAHWLGTPAVRPEREMTADERSSALRYARLHWGYFDRFVSEDTNWLAPDNFQDDPAPAVAMRTSPTNIGLQLLSTVSAHDLGFIDVDDMARRLEHAMRSMERLKRFRGHLYNWYDLHDLRVLEPPYISTVDSGNLAGHLIALRQALLAIADRQAPPADAVELTTRLRALANRADDFVREMDFAFLYDERRELFAIGYQQSSHSLDVSFYDLLASEARLASFIAIARNQVPVDHWFHLGRTLTRASGSTALVSWSGSMFEYLMPTLVMRSFPLTLLDQTYRSAVERQMAYGREHGVPWGTSESAYNLRDRHLTYQYRAFGVPDLALERRIGQDLVVAPYASALALSVAPEGALANLATLEAKGALGDFGFFDSLDYTRPEPGKRFAIVRNYMAHHVGMSLVSLANLLNDRLWQRRFHADPLVRSVELLLHERIPRRLVLQEARPVRPEQALPDLALERPVVREIITPETPQPHVALLGRLPYTIMISHSGAGYSRYEDLAVTRWRADGTTDHTGQFCYVKDVGAGHVWSAAHQPVCAPADWYHVQLATDRVTFQRREHGIETRTEVVVVPEDAAEVRRVTVSNETDVEREIEVTSYGEITIAVPGADRQHPAFSSLFIETEWHAWCSAITATRRPRSSSERTMWCVHVVDAGGGERVGAPSYDTDRARFLGRGRSTRDPVALERDGALSGSTGAVLDPIFAIRVRVRLDPGQSASVAFTTLVADNPERAFALADRYHDPSTAQRALDLAWTSTQVELRELGVSPADAAIFQEIAGHLFYPNPAARFPEGELRRSHGGQPLLWSQGISGDWPILLATIRSADGLPTIAQLFAAHHYWRRHGMMVDLVILNEHPSGYLQQLHEQMNAAMFASSDSAAIEGPGGVFIRRRDQLPSDVLTMLRATARVVVECDGRTLGTVAEAWREVEEVEEAQSAPPVRSRASGQRLEYAPVDVRRVRTPTSGVAVTTGSHRVSVESDRAGAPSFHAPTAAPRFLDNGIGGLLDCGDYEIRVRGDELPPAPWANVIANARGGFIVTERGTGSTWVGNSQFFRLTPWHNDPVSDPPGDALYLRDEETRDLWSATPGPIRGSDPYTVRHSAGSTSFRHHHGGIETMMTVGMAGDDPVRLSLLRITNRDKRPRRIAVTSFVEWTLGPLREHTQHQVVTTFDQAHQALLARNEFNPTFAHMRAFAALSEPIASYTGDRREFVGRNGCLSDPAALREGAAPLSGTVLAGIDPCAVLQCTVILRPGETRELVALLGAADSDDEASKLLQVYRDRARASAALQASVDQWRRRLSTITVRTPEPAFDAMINQWLLYQALSCRMWGRASVYQSSGAFGFRDQLQDVLAFLYAEPGLAREHIVRAAGRQFAEGDVQHWWHPPDGHGVRTRFSDDLAWLPFAVECYVRVTGDATVLDEMAPFISMPALEPSQHERYDLPQPAGASASVYDHCILALQRACTTGAHGLPLIGCGDWNDGMNRVGIEGKGESVWLGWFLTATLRSFATLVERRGDAPAAQELRARADGYAAAVEQHGWDGEWYRRAYFDDGTPLGSAASEECRIDSIAQSWSVISAAGSAERQRAAMRSVETHLVREDARLITLLAPPFDKTRQDPGYIKGYLPGVRENGAQYTHAALWAVQATALLGDGDRAFALYQMLNPLLHARDAAAVAVYKVEPYVVAADVYTAEGQLGRGGWTWYTGSASWMYRVGLETILGFTKHGNTLCIAPRVPHDWKEYAIEYRYGSAMYAISVCRADGSGSRVTVDGRDVPNGEMTLIDDGQRHEVRVMR